MPATNKFNLSRDVLMTGDMGVLYPAGVWEVIPGDYFGMQTALVLRMSPLAAPVMHQVDVRVHFFYVANDILNREETFEWDDFITGGANNDDTQTIPLRYVSTGTQANRIHHYQGVPKVNQLYINELPIRGYNRIWNYYYRDQDLQTPVAETNLALQNVCWEKDYFTTARPWEQKGPQVTLPTGTKAPVTGIGVSNQTYTSGGTNYETGGTGGVTYTSASTGTINVREDPDNSGFPDIYADLSAAAALPVNDFRRAFALQRMAEMRARYGSRITEYCRYIAGRSGGIENDDEPIFIGGGRGAISFSEVLQTAPETGQPSNGYGVGDLYGHGFSGMRSGRARYYVERHGYIHALVSLRPKAVYIDGVDRHWLKQDKEEYFQPELSFIGQQEIFTGEVFMQGSGTSEADALSKDRAVFGYQDRYDEYRSARSYVAGEFVDTLNYWHLARDFSSLPTLNGDFVKCVPSKRIHNVQTEHAAWMMVRHNVGARRVVPQRAMNRIM